jgi:hypothetical protein
VENECDLPIPIDLFDIDEHSNNQEIENESDEDEVARLMAELEEMKKYGPPMELPSMEKLIEDSRKEYSQIRMYDYGLGKMSNQQAIADFYGWNIVHQITAEIEESYNHKLKDRKAGQISKKLWQKIKDIRAGRLPKDDYVHYENKTAALAKNPEPKSNLKAPLDKPKGKKKNAIVVEKRERQKGDDYFLVTERGIIRNETYRNLFKGPSIVYEWLWANIVRDQWKDSQAYPIKERYYKEGFLAYCSTYGKIAKDCGMSKNTVRKYIEDFEEAGVVETESYKPPGKKQGQTVFIIGTWKTVNGEKAEFYYRDKVFITPKPVKN